MPLGIHISMAEHAQVIVERDRYREALERIAENGKWGVGCPYDSEVAERALWPDRDD